MRISIITPCFNSEKSIERTIKSVLNQKYYDLEYIIIDGGSTDTTMDIVNRYADRISKIISEPDKGISDAYNKGINIATGELIGIVAADDELLIGALNRLNEEYDGKSDVFAGAIFEYDSHGYKRSYSNKNLELLRKRTSLNHPATYIRKSAYLKYGNYSLDYKCAMDRELLLRFYCKGATFQVQDCMMSIFNLGGTSYTNPINSSFKEDEFISILYGLNPVRAKFIKFSLCTRYCINKPIKFVLEKMNLIKFVRSNKYVDIDEIKQYIFD